MNLLANKRLNLDIIDIISNLSIELQIKTFLVGGYVRDLILSRQSKDIDVLVIGDGISFAKEVKKKLDTMVNLQIFKNFGTAMIIYDGFEIEFVGSRKESYQQSSRNPSVTIGTFEDDISRRDFTINSIAISLNKNDKGKIIDLFGGLSDVKSGIIKTPKDPKITFYDDPLRMMRAVRFASQLNFKIKDSNLEIIKNDRERINIISKERINDELNKILLSPKPSIGFILLKKTGLLEIIIPELTKLEGIDEIEGKSHKDNFYHTLQVLDNICKNTDNLWLRWVALLHDIGKPKTKRYSKKKGWSFHGHEYVGSKMVFKIFKRLKLPLNNKLNYVKKLILLSSRPVILSSDEITDSAIRRLIFDAGDDIDELMTLCEADITTKNSKLEKKYLNNFKVVRKKIEDVENRDRVRNFQPPISGEFIMNYFGIKPCKEIGLIKEKIKEAILNGDINNDSAQAAELMSKIGNEIGLKKYEK
ncbi:MAG: HD domain-containing protein [Cryomorphaceae bacterium]|nr:MAG: HD domain-containing protein [Cryomorphaceae bacterium]